MKQLSASDLKSYKISGGFDMKHINIHKVNTFTFKRKYKWLSYRVITAQSDLDPWVIN